MDDFEKGKKVKRALFDKKLMTEVNNFKKYGWIRRFLWSNTFASFSLRAEIKHRLLEYYLATCAIFNEFFCPFALEHCPFIHEDQKY